MEHYSDLLNIPTEGNEEAENRLQRPIAAHTNDEITTLEVEAVRSVICPTYKNKGDFLKCENYRGMSLLNHAFKIYESVLEKRLRNIVEEKLGPWQHGVRRGKGTTDMTFVLRQLMEKHWEYDTPMYLAFLYL